MFADCMRDLKLNFPSYCVTNLHYSVGNTFSQQNDTIQCLAGVSSMKVQKDRSSLTDVNISQQFEGCLTMHPYHEIK